jgi:hypothetical protein
MENSIKRLKINNYFSEFTFGETKEENIKLLCEVIFKNNMKGKKISLSLDSFRKQSVFFLINTEGMGVIPLSVENTTSDFGNAIYYAGLIEKNLDIKIELIVTDRCPLIIKDTKKYVIKNDVDLCIINKTIKVYKDPYHLYKNFMKHLINEKIQQLPKNFIKTLCEKNNDFETMKLSTYDNSHK